MGGAKAFSFVWYNHPMVEKWSPGDLQNKLIEDYEDGYSASQTIERNGLEVSSVTLISWLRRHGVEIRSKGSGRRQNCKSCDKSFVTKQGAQIYCDNCGAVYRDRHNILKHGLSKEQFVFLADRSSGECELCGHVPGPRATKSLAIDHDHNTGLIRGLLCGNCNLMMGWIDNPKWLEKALSYQKAEHIEPKFIGRNHPDYDGEDYVRNPLFREEEDHG